MFNWSNSIRSAYKGVQGQMKNWMTPENSGPARGRVGGVKPANQPESIDQQHAGIAGGPQFQDVGTPQPIAPTKPSYQGNNPDLPQNSNVRYRG